MYKKENNQVFYNNKLVKDIDFESFQILNDLYGKDKNNIFYNGIILYGEYDIESFQVLLEQYYTKDKNNVYYDRIKIEGADPETFKNLGNKYGKDKVCIYYGINKIESAIYGSFEIMEDFYAKDSNSVYYKGKMLQGVLSEDFTVLYDGYIKNKFQVFLNKEGKINILLGADPNSFEIMFTKNVYLYSKDKYNVFYRNLKIEGADPETFKVTKYEEDYAEDKNYFYDEGKIIKKK